MIPIRHVLRLARQFGIGAAVLSPLAFAFAPKAAAQGFGPDPFRPYNSQYDAAVFNVTPGPMSSLGGPGLNQNLGGVRGANQFGNYLDSLGEGPGASRRYDQANRAYDKQFGRQYQPNRKADAGFQETRTEVSELYFRYLRESDPRKRAALLQEYKRARTQATRDLNVGGRNARSPRSTTPRANGASGGEAPELDERAELDPARELGAARSPAARRAAPRREAPVGPATAPAGSGGGRSPSQILDRATQPDIPPAPALPGAPRGGGSVPPPPPR